MHTHVRRRPTRPSHSPAPSTPSPTHTPHSPSSTRHKAHHPPSTAPTSPTRTIGPHRLRGVGEQVGAALLLLLVACDGGAARPELNGEALARHALGLRAGWEGSKAAAGAFRGGACLSSPALSFPRLMSPHRTRCGPCPSIIASYTAYTPSLRPPPPPFPPPFTHLLTHSLPSQSTSHPPYFI